MTQKWEVSQLSLLPQIEKPNDIRCAVIDTEKPLVVKQFFSSKNIYKVSTNTQQQ